jgi:hypothetical protein
MTWCQHDSRATQNEIETRHGPARNTGAAFQPRWPARRAGIACWAYAFCVFYQLDLHPGTQFDHAVIRQFEEVRHAAGVA